MNVYYKSINNKKGSVDVCVRVGQIIHIIPVLIHMAAK